MSLKNATTFIERVYGCSFYKEDKNYGSFVSGFYKSIYKNFTSNNTDDQNDSLFTILYKKLLSGKSIFRGLDNNSIITIEDSLINYAENLTTYLNTNTIDYTNNSYIFMYEIKGYVLGLITINEKVYLLDITFRNPIDTFYNLYYNQLNFFLYNKANGTEYDGLVYSPYNNSYYELKYNKNDYTTNKGFKHYNLTNRKKRPGHRCLSCQIKNCKPRLITDLKYLK